MTFEQAVYLEAFAAALAEYRDHRIAKSSPGAFMDIGEMAESIAFVAATLAQAAILRAPRDKWPNSVRG